MLSVPYSRYLIYPIPWYSFLIVLGVVLAVLIACREEKRAGLKKDTVIDLALWLLPGGIIGARIYYVVFSWNQFRDDFLSVFRIWEGGLAIYGAIISGLIVLLVFCRHRGLSPLLLCDLIAPGLALAQSIGRWGNYFNIEAYGLSLSNPSLCFFPLAVRVPADGNAWHMATFFYESVLDLGIFLFLMKFRHSIPHRKGDVFFHYLFLYAAGRLCIEELRTDSLFAVSSVRISQLLSVLICIGILLFYLARAARQSSFSPLVRYGLIPAAVTASVLMIGYTAFGLFIRGNSVPVILAVLCSYSLFMTIAFFTLNNQYLYRRTDYADNKG